jgi:golgin subfamily B member 1
MKKLFVVDTDTKFQNLVRSICPADMVELSCYTSSMEIFSLLATEKPHLIFLDLEIEDLNDFIMHDLLKKTSLTLKIPLIVTYSDLSEAFLPQYEKLKFKAEGYFKKPLSVEQIDQLLSKYLDFKIETEDEIQSEQLTPIEVDEPSFDLMSSEPEISNIPGIDEEPLNDEFSDEHIDRLVKGEFIETEKDDRESTNPFADSMSETNENVHADKGSKLDPDDEDLGFEKNLEDSFKDIPINETEPQNETNNEKVSNRADKGLENQLISLEQQNEFLRTENKELNDTIISLQTEIKATSEEKEKFDEELNRMRENSGEVQGVLEVRNLEISKNMESLQKKYEDLLLQLDASDKDKKELQSKLDEISDVKTILSENLETVALEKTQLETQLEDLKDSLKKLEEDKEILFLQEEKSKQEMERLMKESIDEKSELLKKIEELSNSLTDKEREVVALNHEFEKDLQVKSDQLVQQTIERLTMDSKQKESLLTQELQQLREAGEQKQSALLSQIDPLKESITALETENKDLSKREESLNRTVSTLAEEKVTLSEKISAIEVEAADIMQQMKEKEAKNKETEQSLSAQLQESRELTEIYKEKVQSLSGLFQNALSITNESGQSKE